jgi:mRNA deadenylase 3'-5' endonuclease subunit Ccr4
MLRLVANVSRAANCSWSFSIAQWNILGGYLASPKHFPYCKPELLEWENRKHRILKELTEYQVCREL